jgi:hypothetical protein
MGGASEPVRTKLRTSFFVNIWYIFLGEWQISNRAWDPPNQERARSNFSGTPVFGTRGGETLSAKKIR